MRITRRKKTNLLVAALAAGILSGGLAIGTKPDKPAGKPPSDDDGGQYLVTPLTWLVGVTNTRATAISDPINAAGDVYVVGLAGFATEPAPRYGTAWRVDGAGSQQWWVELLAERDLEDADGNPIPDGVLESYLTHVSDVNHLGEAVGTEHHGQVDFDQRHAWLWALEPASGDPPIGIDLHPPDEEAASYIKSEAVAINRSGHVLGTVARGDDVDAVVLWQPDTLELTPVRYPSGEVFNAAFSYGARDISDPILDASGGETPYVYIVGDHHVVQEGPAEAYSFRLTVDTETGVIVEATFFDAGLGGGPYLWLTAVNRDGDVVGGSGVQGSLQLGFVWQDFDGNMQADAAELKDLVTLGGTRSDAADVNNRVNGVAQIVGWANTTGTDPTRGALWEYNGMTHAPSDPVNLTKAIGWDHGTAGPINNAGQIGAHAKKSRNKGGFEGLLLTP